MKVTFSNFVFTGTTGISSKDSFQKNTHHADVDVTTETGLFMWKKSTTETRSVYRAFADFWRYADTGEYAENEVCNLASAYSAKHGVEL